MSKVIQFDQVQRVIEDCCLSHIMALAPGLNEWGSKRLLDAHLEPAHFAMPVHDEAIERQLVKWAGGHEPMEAASSFLRFEDTRSIVGIARVMARTHTNRQGVAGVTRGARWKVQSPRVVGLFSSSTDEATLREWCNFTSLINDWQALASQTTDALDARFQDVDKLSLNALAVLAPNVAASMTVKNRPDRCSSGWARVVLGFYSGLLYLRDRWNFDADRLWAVLDSAQDAASVETLCKEAQRRITEFGVALAPSFFADLGNTNFVKPDVHVIEISSAAMGLAGQASPQQAIDFVCQMGRMSNRTPRAIDKLLFLAASGNFYLAGLKPSKKKAMAGKRKLIEMLQAV